MCCATSPLMSHPHAHLCRSADGHGFVTPSKHRIRLHQISLVIHFLSFTLLMAMELRSIYLMLADRYECDCLRLKRFRYGMHVMSCVCKHAHVMLRHASQADDGVQHVHDVLSFPYTQKISSIRAQNRSREIDHRTCIPHTIET